MARGEKPPSAKRSGAETGIEYHHIKPRIYGTYYLIQVSRIPKRIPKAKSTYLSER